VEEKTVLYGLLLVSKDETNLFPKELVFPSASVGIDKNNPSKPERVLTYQLNANVCPHVTEKNTCRIYERRPLICRAFPLISVGQMGVTIAEPQQCLFVETIEKERGSLTAILPMTPKKIKAVSEWEYVRLLGNCAINPLMKFRLSGESIWKFNLANKEWFKI
jgi:Fe-S-cluster containining protein